MYTVPGMLGAVFQSVENEPLNDTPDKNYSFIRQPSALTSGVRAYRDNFPRNQEKVVDETYEQYHDVGPG